jgi:signal peptidase I
MEEVRSHLKMARYPILSRFWREWLRPLLVVGTLLGSFRSAVADWNDVPSGSMEPTILVGDRVFVNKVAYDPKVPFTTWRLARWGNPRRGDVVVLFSPHDGRRLVKRVVGLPGDRVEVQGFRLRVNGAPAGYAPLPRDVARDLDREGMPERSLASETLGACTHPIMAATVSGPGADFGPVTVPPDRYFLMGDHRDNSFDSRFWGFAEREAIVGRASAVVLSLDHERFYLPRWHRFFSPLP